VLDRDKQELLTLGLIKMGEALTFCRDKHSPYVGTDLRSYASQFAHVRNHLVHWQMYDNHRNPPSYSKLTDLITQLPNEADFNTALNCLMADEKGILTKPVGRGSMIFNLSLATT